MSWKAGGQRARAGSPGEEGCPVERPGYQMDRASWGLAVHVMRRVLQEDIFDSPLSTWKLLMAPNLTAGRKETGVNVQYGNPLFFKGPI